MSHAEVWNEILRLGSVSPSSLSPLQRTIFWVNRFVIDIDVDGLSGFLYNISPAAGEGRGWDRLRRTADAVEVIGHPECAAILRQSADALESGSTIDDILESDIEPTIEFCTDELWTMLEQFTDVLTEAVARTGDPYYGDVLTLASGAEVPSGRMWVEQLADRDLMINWSVGRWDDRNRPVELVHLDGTRLLIRYQEPGTEVAVAGLLNGPVEDYRSSPTRKSSGSPNPAISQNLST